MKKRLFLLATCLFTGLRAEPAAVVVEAAAEAPEFIRVEEGETATRLQTSVTRYTKDGATVELVGAVHIADKKYYEDLNTRFTGYDALLFEGIGSPPPPPAAGEEVAPEPPPAAEAAPAEKKPGKLDGLHGAYRSGANWLGLSYQMQEIDYRKANFVHADLSVEEFTALQAERKESLLGFVLKAGLQENAKPVKEPSTLKLLTSLVRRDKNGLKRELVHSLGAGDDQIAAIAGDSVIITDRNAKCLQVLDREVQAGKTKLGIFYGAAHFPDMEKKLLAAGWEKTGTEWLTAWDIGK
ncbi:hypothetical protein OKA04_04145 [Luteolibacter flavescens]|uniref:TraB/GumN family protein n=1 Tax=Luteolibacter flavescens TaxID=1859460 RepID=A0ABT3FK28_9BACT|nr:hypothetical protein [Luteolibacter flavescens]MCW1883905.1 hypothetical protein [Luteolibacter flavescens]